MPLFANEAQRLAKADWIQSGSLRAGDYAETFVRFTCPAEEARMLYCITRGQIEAVDGFVLDEHLQVSRTNRRPLRDRQCQLKVVYRILGRTMAGYDCFCLGLEILLPRKEDRDSWLSRVVEEPLRGGAPRRKSTFVDGIVDMWTWERPAFFLKHKSYYLSVEQREIVRILRRIPAFGGRWVPDTKASALEPAVKYLVPDYRTERKPYGSLRPYSKGSRKHSKVCPGRYSRAGDVLLVVSPSRKTSSRHGGPPKYVLRWVVVQERRRFREGEELLVTFLHTRPNDLGPPHHRLQDDDFARAFAEYKEQYNDYEAMWINLHEVRACRAQVAYDKHHDGRIEPATYYSDHWLRVGTKVWFTPRHTDIDHDIMGWVIESNLRDNLVYIWSPELVCRTIAARRTSRVQLNHEEECQIWFPAEDDYRLMRKEAISVKTRHVRTYRATLATQQFSQLAVPADAHSSRQTQVYVIYTEPSRRSPNQRVRVIPAWIAPLPMQNAKQSSFRRLFGMKFDATRSDKMFKDKYYVLFEDPSQQYDGGSSRSAGQFYSRRNIYTNADDAYKYVETFCKGGSITLIGDRFREFRRNMKSFSERDNNLYRARRHDSSRHRERESNSGTSSPPSSSSAFKSRVTRQRHRVPTRHGDPESSTPRNAVVADVDGDAQSRERADTQFRGYSKSRTYSPRDSSTRFLHPTAGVDPEEGDGKAPRRKEQVWTKGDVGSEGEEEDDDEDPVVSVSPGEASSKKPPRRTRSPPTRQHVSSERAPRDMYYATDSSSERSEHRHQNPPILSRNASPARKKDYEVPSEHMKRAWRVAASADRQPDWVRGRAPGHDTDRSDISAKDADGNSTSEPLRLYFVRDGTDGATDRSAGHGGRRNTRPRREHNEMSGDNVDKTAPADKKPRKVEKGKEKARDLGRPSGDEAKAAAYDVQAVYA